MIQLNKARELAREKVSTLFKDAILYEDPEIEGSFGWVFGYQSAAYMKSGSLSDAIIGGGPILVDRKTSQVIVLGSGMPSEYYVKNYVCYGDPYKRPGRKVELSGAQLGFRKGVAVRLVRDFLEITLIEAKSAVDASLQNQKVILECRYEHLAQELVSKLRNAGFIARQIPE